MYGNDFSHGQDIPLGLSMALAQNPKAIDYFGTLDGSHKQQVINCAHHIRTKSQMHQLVDSLAHNEMPENFTDF